MKKSLLVALIVLAGHPVFFAQSPVRYHKVKVDLTNTTLWEIAQLGLETEHGEATIHHLVNDFSLDELAKLRAAGIPFQVLRTDVQDWYRSPERDLAWQSRTQATCTQTGGVPAYTIPKNYPQGSMGGFVTYTELLETLDSMRAKYPQLISQRAPIGTHLTEEGRAIYWLRISDNPDQDESEPEVLYTALHHAREPASLSQMLFFMWYVLENYATDPEIQYLVDETELYFIPCINPDGYIYNESIQPNGGGLWRKNRWKDPQNNQTYGVDLNRNYGDHWGYDNTGSSPSKTSDTYRGTAAFSEPEIQAVRDLCNAHQFQLALNYHSYGDLLIHPYGYVNQLTPDDPTFKAFGRTMTRENNYFVGTGTETVGYLVNGDSDDWMYGEQTTKPKIYSMTPEAGPNFWPPASQIQEVNRACLRQNMVTAHLVHSFVEWEENGPFSLPTTNGQFKLELQQYGLQAGGVDVSVSALSSNINLTFSTQSVNLSHLQTQDLIIPYQVIPSGTSVVEEIEIAVTLDYGSFSETQKITRQYLTGSQGITFSEDGQNLQNWEVNGDWGTTTVWYTSAPSSFTDSPVGQYAANDENTMELEKAVDLSQADYAVLRFQSRWDIENNFDYGQVLASSDGVNFSPLCGQYTNEGTQYQDQGEPVFDGQQADWVEESMDLSEYLGDSLYLRFLLKSDGFVEGDGWYIDDLEVETYSAGPTGIENDWRKMWQDIKVFPQPAEGLLNLSFTNIQHLANMKISFWDMTGRKLGEEQLGALPAGPQQLSWDISAWKDGLYFLYLETDQGYRHMLKVVKK